MATRAETPLDRFSLAAFAAWNRCCYCGTETAAGRVDRLGRFRCDGCRDRHEAVIEADRLAALAREVAEREAMWCLPPA